MRCIFLQVEGSHFFNAVMCTDVPIQVFIAITIYFPLKVVPFLVKKQIIEKSIRSLSIS